MKAEKQLFYTDLMNSNNVQIFCKYYGTTRDEVIVSQLKAGLTYAQIANGFCVARSSISRIVDRISKQYTKFCKCVGEITADRLKGEQND